MTDEQDQGASDKSDRATAAEPVVSALRASIPSASNEFVQLEISSFRGSIGGEHYYGQFNVHTKEEQFVRGDGTVGWVSRFGFGTERHPHDAKSIERKIGAKEAAYLNKKDNAGFLTPSFRLKPGDSVTRFNDKASIVEAATAIFPTLFDPSDILVVEERHCEGIYDVLVGPPEIATFFAEHRSYAQQHQFLIERGYLRKIPAQAIEVRSGETEGLDPKGESAVAESDAPKGGSDD